MSQNHTQLGQNEPVAFNQAMQCGGAVGLFIAAMVVWSAAVRIFHIPAYLIPPPNAVWSVFVRDWRGLLADTCITATEAGLGFAAGTIIGMVCGICFAHSRYAESVFHPYLVGLQAVPVVAIAPLLVIWFGSGMVGKVVLAAFISYFPVVVSTTYGLRRVRTELAELMTILAASRTEMFRHVRFPASLPFVFSALKVSSTLSVIGAIVGEIAGSNKGIGHRILIASYRTDTDSMFAGIAFAALLGLFFYSLVRLAAAVLLRNHNHNYEME